MTVIVVTQYSGGTLAQITGAAPAIKHSILRHGAQFYRIGQVFAGDTPGTWAVARGYPDWAAFGRANQAMEQDSEYQGLLAGIAPFTRPTARALHQLVLHGGTPPANPRDAVSQATFYKGGALGDTRSSAGEARDIFLAAGASDYLFTRVTAGVRVGQWMSSARFADWAAYGAAQDKLAADQVFAALLARVAGWAEMTGRLLISWADV
jgi:hypothetical protein